MTKKILLALVALVVVIGISLALGPAGKIGTAQFVPGSSHTLTLSTHDTLTIASGGVYDTVTVVMTKPDTAEAYVEIIPHLGWPFLEEAKNITVVVSYQGTKQENLEPKGLYGLDANGGWVYLNGCTDRAGNYTFTYQIRQFAAREMYAGRRASGEFKAFKVDAIKRYFIRRDAQPERLLK